MGLITRVDLNLALDFTGTGSLGTRRFELSVPRSFNWGNGTGADQANVLFEDKRTLADAASETLNLYDSGTLLDALGAALTMAKLKLLYLRNTSSDASLLVGGGATPVGLFNDPTHGGVVKPGGIWLWTAPAAAGLDVTTNKNLVLAHDGAGSSDLVYEIAVVGID